MRVERPGPSFASCPGHRMHMGKCGPPSLREFWNCTCPSPASTVSPPRAKPLPASLRKLRHNHALYENL